MEDLSYFEERLSTAEAELHISKKVSDRQEKIVDTKDIVLFTPETDTKDVTSNALEEHSARSENFTDETPIYCEDNEVSEMSDMDDPNLSGLSLLEPDPSLGCLPKVRGFAKKKRSTPWTYVTPEEPPQQTAWKYLMKRNIIRLLEVMTAEIFFHRFSSPIDYMIEATERARLKHQQEERPSDRRRSRRKSDKDKEIEGNSTLSLSTTDRSEATTDSGLIIFPSQDDYMSDVILAPTQNDISAQDETKDTGTKKKTRNTERPSTVTLVSNDDGDDVTAMITCFPIDASPEVEVDWEAGAAKCDVSETNQSPRLISSTEALKLLNYLS